MKRPRAPRVTRRPRRSALRGARAGPVQRERDPYESRFKTNAQLPDQVQGAREGRRGPPLHEEARPLREGPVLGGQRGSRHRVPGRQDHGRRGALRLSDEDRGPDGPRRDRPGPHAPVRDVRGTFHLDTKTGVLEDAHGGSAADVPHRRHDDRRRSARRPTGSRTASSPPATCPSPDWSFTMSEATITLDDYARMKDVAFRAGHGAAPLHAVPDLADEGGPRLGHARARASATATSAAASSGLSYYWVTGRSDGPDDRSSTSSRTARSASGEEVALAADRRVGRHLPGLRHPRPERDRLRAHRPGAAGRRQRPLHAARRLARRLHAEAGDALEAAPRPRVRRPALRTSAASSRSATTPTSSSSRTSSGASR